MEKLSMCRMCLVANVNMYVVANKKLKEIYEKLTNIPLVTEDRRPMLACFFCLTKLKQCCRWQRQCLEAEKMFAQILNEDFETKPQLNQDQLEFSRYNKSPTVHVCISDECHTESDVIKDVWEGQDDENQSELGNEQQDIKYVHIPTHHIKRENTPPHHSESGYIPPQHSEFDSKDDVLLMKLKTEVDEEQEVSKTKRKANEMKKSEHEFQVIKIEYTPTHHSESEEIPPQHTESEDIPAQNSESNSEDDVLLMKLKTEVEGEQKVSKTKRKANDTKRTSVAKKPKVEDTFTAQQKKTEQPYSNNTKPTVNNTVVETNCRDNIYQHMDSVNVNILRRLCIKEKAYKCDICERSFHKKSNLERHFSVHTGDKPNKCDICHRSFIKKHHLIRHIRVHTGDKPYKCEICQRSFSDKANLSMHIRVHTGDKPYKCETCQRSFTRKFNLTNHIRVHTGDKPYKCEICQRSFTKKIALTRHIQVHTGDKPYKCDICHRSFIQKNHLTTHIRVHTGDKPYKM